MININELTQQDINNGLIKVKDAIVAEHEHFNMEWFHNYSVCNSTMCITGWLAHIIDPKLDTFGISSLGANLASININNYNILDGLACPINAPCKFKEITPQQACQAIDNYIAGNYQNPWDGVK